MKQYDLSIIIIFGIVIACIVGGVISVHYLGPNNPIEEVAEEIIQEETGVKPDLSPKVPEKSAS